MLDSLPRGALELTHAKFPLSTVPPQNEVGDVEEAVVKRHALFPLKYSKLEIWPVCRPKRGTANKGEAGQLGAVRGGKILFGWTLRMIDVHTTI